MVGIQGGCEEGYLEDVFDARQHLFIVVEECALMWMPLRVLLQTVSSLNYLSLSTSTAEVPVLPVRSDPDKA